MSFSHGYEGWAQASIHLKNLSPKDASPWTPSEQRRIARALEALSSVTAERAGRAFAYLQTAQRVAATELGKVGWSHVADTSPGHLERLAFEFVPGFRVVLD